MLDKFKNDIKKHEHYYRGKNHRIDYLQYNQADSNHLIVVLSGFNGKETHGAPAKYNYMRTLNDIHINKLFIKDSVDNVPVYYMGTEGSTSYLDDVCALIEEKLEEMKVAKEQLIISGSSKGGTGALLIGLTLGAGHIIAGASQLNVGTYLSTLNEKLKEMLFTQIIGHNNADAPEILDRKFRERLLVKETRSQFYFHGGNRDLHYSQHMVPMLRHFDAHGILYELDLRGYEGHENVKYYFPDYFERTVKGITARTFIERPKVTARGEETEIDVKINNTTDNTDWAIYVYKKDKKIVKIMYNTDRKHTVPVRYEDIRSVKVFLRVNGEKKQVEDYIL
ncbi:accessory Sec system protein Asp2 [Salinicoccus hispanicus]|uniref:Uncharacterized protein n=1 Tax=Salinicoccus hispanicus TaxID=157225 RepID=A0A6N8U3Y8_9STAP|nr:accessory Sec system protein Asp2 [Salinicoccus hispanicus]MXQ50941.1 hypothetical protein [Salinicoccus hispanicus]